VKESCEPNCHFAEIVRASNAAIFSVTPECRFESWNPGAEALFGYASEDVRGRDVLMIFPEDRLAEAVANHARAIAGKAFRWETIARHKSSRLMEVAMSLAPMRDDNEKITGVCAVAQKLTKHRMTARANSNHVDKRQLLERARLGAVARERKRIGQQLHDHLCQQLLGAAFAAKALSNSLPPASDATAEADELARLVNSAVQQVRDITRGLNHATTRSAANSKRR